MRRPQRRDRTFDKRPRERHLALFFLHILHLSSATSHLLASDLSQLFFRLLMNEVAPDAVHAYADFVIVSALHSLPSVPAERRFQLLLPVSIATLLSISTSAKLQIVVAHLRLLSGVFFAFTVWWAPFAVVLLFPEGLSPSQSAATPVHIHFHQRGRRASLLCVHIWH